MNFNLKSKQFQNWFEKSKKYKGIRNVKCLGKIIIKSKFAVKKKLSLKEKKNKSNFRKPRFENMSYKSQVVTKRLK